MVKMSQQEASPEPQEELTKSGRRIIPVEWVGEMDVYSEITTPKTVYPTGEEVHYEDAYLQTLTALYSLDSVLGERKRLIAQGNYGGLEPLVKDFPILGVQDVLARILINSAKIGIWQPLIIDIPMLVEHLSIETAKDYLKLVEKTDMKTNSFYEAAKILSGISSAKRGGFVFPTECDGRVIVSPSQDLLEYFITRTETRRDRS